MKNSYIKVVDKFSSLANGIAIFSNAAGTCVVLCLVLVVCYDVLARGLFNKPFMGAVEVVQFSMILIVFLQLPDVVRVNRLTRSDGFLVILKHKAPFAAQIVRRFIDSISCVLMVLISVAMWPEFVEMFETKDYFGVPGIFVAPWWPIKFIIFVSAVLCSSLFFFKVILPTNSISLIRMDEQSQKTDKPKA